MEAIAEKRFAAKIESPPAEHEVREERVERAFEAGRMGREAVARVYETLLPRLRRVLDGRGGLPPISDVRSNMKESC
jgi:hypothetical protein